MLLIRRATLGDLDLTYEWASDSQVRARSFNSDPFSFDTHRAWFEKKLVDDGCFMYVFEAYAETVGIVRIEGHESAPAAVISVTVAPEARGKRYSSQMIRQALEAYWKTERLSVYAYIKLDNLPSFKAFKQAGFGFDRMDTVNEVPCKVMRIDRNEYFDAQHC